MEEEERNDNVNDTPNPHTDDLFTGEKHLDGRWAWVVMIAALLTHILTFGAAYASVGALYVEFLKDFGQSESATALTGSILLGTMLCAGPLASILVGRFGARMVAVSGGVFASSGLILSALAKGLIHLYFTFGFLTGLGYGLSYLPCIVMVGNFFERKRTVAGGIAVSGSGLGTFLVAPITQGLLDAFGYRKALIVLGCIELILCFCGATYVPSKIPIRKIDVIRDDVESILGSGSVLTASILEGTTVFTKPSDVSFMMQAAMCSSGLSFSGQSRTHTREATTNTPHEFGTNSPLSQPSASFATSSVLAQAALGLGALSPSTGLSSSLVLSSSKVSEQVRSPAAVGSPITSIPDEWLESVALTMKADDNDTTLTARRKPDFPTIPEEFIGLTKSSEQASVATIVIAQGPNPTDEDTNTLGARAVAAKVMEESTRELEDASDIQLGSSYSSNTSNKNAQAHGPILNGVLNVHLNASYSSNTSNKHDPSVYSSVDEVTIPDFPVQNINDLMIQFNDHYINPSGDKDDDMNVQDQDDVSLSSSTLFPNPQPSTESKTFMEEMLILVNLFKNRFFIFFCLSNLFVCIGYQLPYMYFKAFALSMGLGEDSWVLILSVMGITNTIGRVLVGFMFNYVHTDHGRLYGFAMSMIIAGTILTLTSLADSYVSLLCYATAFALVAGSTDCLVAALLVGFVGLDTLGYSFGMTIEMQGIGFIIGPPIAGFMYSLTGTYSAVFCTGGVAFILSGFALLLEPLIAYIRKENKIEDMQLSRI
ncbi:uncharacterized protein [Amphiura filiformis]|uniref:uncharacterized protein n=1 Tax=Amphiura filiformis TaxID=82378 RepID=UPI003B225D5A